MSVEQVELDCWEYCNLVKDMNEFPAMYGLDKMRSNLHEKISKRFNLTKKQTDKITFNLDKINYNGTELYLKLLDLSRKFKDGE